MSECGELFAVPTGSGGNRQWWQPAVVAPLKSELFALSSRGGMPRAAQSCSARVVHHAPLDPRDLPEVLLARGLSISVSSRP